MSTCSRVLFGVMSGVCSLLSIVAQPYGLDQRPIVGPFLNGSFPPTEQVTSSWEAVAAFPNLSFDDPTCFTPEPRSNRLYVCGRQGVIYWFENDPEVTAKNLFLDLSAQTQGHDDCGLLGLAFHPEYGQEGSRNRGFVYVYYSFSVAPTTSPEEETPGYNRLSRFTVPDGSLVANPASELVLINQFDQNVWHNGGGMFFGPDGFLYLSNGDGGGVNDPYNNSQRIDSGLFSGVLRIDVDMDAARSHPIRRQPLSGDIPPFGWPVSFTQNYYVPNDNPWLDPAGSLLEEFYALGLRSPHRMTYDALSGRIWLADVGQDAWEEVDILEKGGNYQWSYMEGTHAGQHIRPASIIGTEKTPIYDYPHASGNNCVIGGYVYRGAQDAAYLSGQYIFGDNGSGRIWAMTYDGSSPGPQVNYLCTVPNGGTQNTGLSSFGLDQQGELYMCVMGQGTKIYKLSPVTSQGTPPPQLLSQTGAFSDLGSLTANPSLIPYAVNSPLWSDGAAKFRWMAIPNDGPPYTSSETIGFSAGGSWSFPIGTVFIKHFELPIRDAEPSLRKRLETRFLIHATNGNFYGLSYKWRPDASDADLLTGSVSETNFIETAEGYRDQVWYYPSRQDCLTCHNANANQVLGVRTCQLNGNATYGGGSDNQLRALNHIGMFSEPIPETNIALYPRSVPITDKAATLEDRVRSYLDANCAQCHRPNGARAFFDARLDTPLESQGIVNGLVANALGITGAKVVVPHKASQSLLFIRDSLTGQNQMPPLARNVVDTNYLQVLSEWIQSLPAAFQPTPVGNLADGIGTDPLTDSWINAGRFRAADDLRATAMFAQVVGIAGRYKCAIYGDDDGEPSALLGESAEISNPESGWHKFLLSTPVNLLANQYYWLAVWSDDARAAAYYSSREGVVRWGFHEYGQWPDPLTTTDGGAFNYCIYASGESVSAAALAISVLGDGSYRIRLKGTPAITYRVEYAATLDASSWETLPTEETDTEGIFEFIDSPSSASRFYRATYP